MHGRFAVSARCSGTAGLTTGEPYPNARRARSRQGNKTPVVPARFALEQLIRRRCLIELEQVRDFQLLFGGSSFSKSAISSFSLTSCAIRTGVLIRWSRLIKP